MHTATKILFLLFTVVYFTGCRPDTDFPDEPEIKFKDFILYDDLRAELIFEFTDGDGNVGFKAGDTTPPFNRGGDHYYNFFMDYYVKKDGEFVKLTPLIPFYYRLPYLEPEGKKKSLQGTISVKDITPFPITLDYDTVKFLFYMEDRKFNKSNVVWTPDIIRPR